MSNWESAKEKMFRDTNRKPLKRWWAKFEIVFGLSAIGVSLLIMPSIEIGTKVGESQLALAMCALVLFVLGSYLTLAGHRSHLYQSQNEQTAYIVTQLGVKQLGNGQSQAETQDRNNQ